MIVEAKEEGIKEGINQEKIEIAKKLLSRNINIKEIIAITDLTENEILLLK